MSKNRSAVNKLVQRYRLVSAPAFRGLNQPFRVKRFMNSRVGISHRYRYVYCRQSKAANSTIAIALHQHELAGYARDGVAPEPAAAGRSATAAAKRALKRDGLVSLSRRQIREISEFYFIFTFVRNPYTRLLSAYLDKIAPAVRMRDGRRASVCRTRGLPPEAEVPFAEFVAYLENGALHQDPHWIPQVDMIPSHLFEPSYVGRVERINDDLPHVLKQIFGACRWEPDGKDGASHATGAGEKLRAYYNDELVERVATLYQADFDRFGYDTRLDLS